jgi:hypothetical protein
MLTKNDFPAADWNTLRDTQYLVGLATLLAEPSGFGTIKESIALAQGIMENQSSPFPFIRDMTNKAEMEAAQGALRQRFGAVEAKPAAKGALQQAALEQVRASMSILSGKASKEESDAYSKLLYGLAETVANAATEGGFLGFGGKRVSAGEQSFLDQLRDTLHLERVSKA